MLKLEIVRARKGDSLLLHYGTDTDPKLVLIDGGPSRVWKPHLKARIEAVRAERGLEAHAPLRLDMIMISHIDDDHIKGILDMTRELIADADAHRPLMLETETLWHNTFNDIIGDTPDQLQASITASFGTADFGDRLPEDDEIDHHTSMILASVNQGRTLRDAAEKLNWPVNRYTPGLVMASPDDPAPVDLPGGLKLHIVGPLKPELQELQEKHDKYLADKGLGRESPEAALAAFRDKSVANLSSLVAIAEADGKRILLTGDARGDKVLDGLEACGHLTPGGTLHLDVLKIMHHGSNNNVTRGFFERVTADHYVFCGDGEHGNPERSTMEMLFGARPDGGFTLHFSYRIDEIDEVRKKIRESHGGHHWDAEQDSLRSFLDGRSAAGIPFEIIEPGDDEDSTVLTLV